MNSRMYHNGKAKNKAALVLCIIVPNRITFSSNISWGDVWLLECGHAVVISKFLMQL